MDAPARASQSLRVLLELRPALDEHAGIPQQTRLLFRGMTQIPDFVVEGLIQSSTHALTRGLPLDARGWFSALPKHRQIDRLARVVISLEQKFMRSYVSLAPLLLRRLWGGAEPLEVFDAMHFRDFIWRRLFAKTLPPEDFEVVTHASFRIARMPWTTMHVASLLSKALSRASVTRLNTRGCDVMIAETPYPAIVSRGTHLVVRYHDAIPLLMPDTISQRRHHQAFHYNALRHNVESGAWFACVSEATRADLLSVFPQVERRAVTIHNLLAHNYFDERSSPLRVPEIARRRLNARVHRGQGFARDGLSEGSQDWDYLLMVSTIEPRKNHLALLLAWERLRTTHFSGLKLLLVGSLGWRHATIVRKYRPWLDRGEAFMLEDVPTPELRLLYKHARAVICPSFAEGFDLSGVEAMKSGGVVVASNIAAHREVYAEAAQLFNPYSVDDLVQAISSVGDRSESGRRAILISRGAAVARRYESDEIIPQWQEFLAATCAISA